MIDVLCSGGIDSFIHLHWALRKFGRDRLRPVYFRAGQRCADREIAAARKLCARVDLPLDIIELQYMEQDPVTGHVPFRNLTFLLAVARRMDSEGVVFGTLLGEISEDKNPKFVRQVQKIVDGQLVSTIYAPGRNFKIYTPYAHASKTQMLRGFLKDICADMREGGDYRQQCFFRYLRFSRVL